MSQRALGRVLLATALVILQVPPAGFAKNEAVDTHTSTAVKPINSEQIANLPVGGRNYSDLLTLTPGISANKSSQTDSLNWARQPMPNDIYQSLQSIDPAAIEQINTVSSPYNAEYGRGAVSGFSQYYLEDLARSREWPGEAVGTSGSIIATGTSGGKPVAVLYDDEGYPIDYYTGNEIKNNPDDVLDDLHEMCDLIGSGKLSVKSGTLSSGTLSNGKISTSSGKLYLDYWGDISYGLPNPKLSMSSTNNLYSIDYPLPNNYRLDPDFKYKGGGMQQIDPPATSGTAPTESVLDDLGPGPTPPLHAQPEGEPTVKNSADGSSVRTYPDGTTEHISPDGGTFVRYADGASFQRFPDGTAVDRSADGSTTTRDKDGKVTAQTGPTVIDLDKKIHRALDRSLVPPQPSTGGQQDQQKSQGQPGTKPRSRLTAPRNWLGAFAQWLIQDATAAPAAARAPRPQVTQASTTDADGNTTTLNRESDGSVTRTVTDSNGKVIEKGTVPKQEPTKVPPRDKTTRASATDSEGNTVTVKKEDDGTVTRTVTDKSGKVIEKGAVTKPEPTKAAPRQPGSTTASTTDANGNTVSIKRNPDGSSTMTVTDPSGKVLQSKPLTAPEPTKVPPRDKTTRASTIDANGNTITIEKKPGGVMTRTVTGPDGKVLESNPVKQPEPTKVPAPNRTTSVSTTDADGNTTTISRNPEGGMTRTVTGPDGKVISQNPVAKPEPTKAAPRERTTSVSATDENGNTTTIKRNPDGTMTRTVTDPNNKVIESAPVTPPPPTVVAPRKPATSASATLPDGTTISLVKQEDGSVVRTITDKNNNVLKRTAISPPTMPTLPAQQPGTVRAVTTDADGNSAVVDANSKQGTVTQTLSDSDGNILAQAPMTAPEGTQPKPTDPVIPDVRTTDAQGNIVMLQPQPNGDITQIIKDPKGAVLQQGTIEAQPKAAGDDMNWSAFVQDSWSILPNMTLNAGFRYEAQYAKPTDGKADAVDPITGQATDGSELDLTDLYAPRIGLIYDWTKEGRAKVYANYGRFYESIPMDINTRSFGGEVTYENYWDWHLEHAGEPFIPSRTPTPQYIHDFAFNSQNALLRGFGNPDTFPAFGTPAPFAESGFRIGDYMYTNLGVYRHGEHPIFGNQRQTTPAPNSSSYYVNDRWQMNDKWSYNFGVRYEKTENTTGTAPSPAATSTGGYQPLQPAFGGGRPYRPIVQIPQNWQPQMVGVLPYGCGHPEKTGVLEEMRIAVSGKLPTARRTYFWEPVYWRSPQEKKAVAASSGDPLYANGSSMDQAAMKSPPKTKRNAAPDMSMAAPPGMGGGLADFGPSHAIKDKGPQALDQWGLFAVGFSPQGSGQSAWDLVNTANPNTVVAIIDSGLDLSHPDGPPHVWTNPKEIAGNNKDDDGNGLVDDVHGWNFNDESADLTDTIGHGTLVAGIIAAKRNNGIGIAGINPGAQIMALKVTDASGHANSLSIFRAIHYAVAQGARVINISLGEAGVSKLEQLAINYAHARNVVIVIAAGNQAGDASQIGPGAARRAITVAAINMDRAHNKLSNTGAPIALAAPGENIYSLHSKDAKWPGSSMERERHYRTATGTSFSAPIVAATASLILAKNPKLPNVLIEDLLLNSAQGAGASAWNDSMGWGLLNARQALLLDPGQLITIWPNEVVADKSAVRVYGTIRGIFSNYRVEIGKGRQPREWQAVGAPATRPVTQGLLAFVSGEQLKGIKEGVVRITAENSAGAKRIAEVPFNL